MSRGTPTRVTNGACNKTCPSWLIADDEGPQGAQWEGPSQQHSPLQWPLGKTLEFSNWASVVTML
jgi:hypothetical protein